MKYACRNVYHCFLPELILHVGNVEYHTLLSPRRPPFPKQFKRLKSRSCSICLSEPGAEAIIHVAHSIIPPAHRVMPTKKEDNGKVLSKQGEPIAEGDHVYTKIRGGRHEGDVRTQPACATSSRLPHSVYHCPPSACLPHRGNKTAAATAWQAVLLSRSKKSTGKNSRA